MGPGQEQFWLKSESVSHSGMANSCDPMDCSPPGSSVHGILQARILEWVAIPFSRGCPWPRNQIPVSCIVADSLPSKPRRRPPGWYRCKPNGEIRRGFTEKWDLNKDLEEVREWVMQSPRWRNFQIIGRVSAKALRWSTWNVWGHLVWDKRE